MPSGGPFRTCPRCRGGTGSSAGSDRDSAQSLFGRSATPLLRPRRGPGAFPPALRHRPGGPSPGRGEVGPRRYAELRRRRVRVRASPPVASQELVPPVLGEGVAFGAASLRGGGWPDLRCPASPRGPGEGRPWGGGGHSQQIRGRSVRRRPAGLLGNITSRILRAVRPSSQAAGLPSCVLDGRRDRPNGGFRARAGPGPGT